MALVLVFVNRSHLAPVSDYDVEVLVGDGTHSGSKVITRGRVEGHRREDGWKALVQAFLRNEADDGE